MFSKNKIKFINSLKKSKYREIQRLFFAEGEKLADELLKSGIKITNILATKNWLELNSNRLTKCKAEVDEITETDLSKISSLSTPNQVFIIAEQPKSAYDIDEITGQLSLLLDDINDPGNLGTIIRIADWFGIQNIFCTKNSVDQYNPKVVQSTMGAICRVKVHYVDFQNLINSVKKDSEFAIYGTFLEGNTIYTEPLTEKGFIIMGSESHGISDKTKPLITKKLFIPNYPEDKKTSESLNISVATAIVCSEFRRRAFITQSGAKT
ncbi:MAG: TrmH family RNA methyltransferase [Bacteroidales bacterium]